MNGARAAAVLLASLAACGDKSQPAGGDRGQPASAGPTRAPTPVTAAWSWGDQAAGDGGARPASRSPPWTVGGFRIAFGERLIGMITSHRPKSLPYSDGLELMVELRTVDRQLVAERAMAGRGGPSFVQTRPVFVAQTDGERGRTRQVGPGPLVLDGDMAYAIAGGRVVAFRISVR